MGPSYIYIQKYSPIKLINKNTHICNVIAFDALLPRRRYNDATFDTKNNMYAIPPMGKCIASIRDADTEPQKEMCVIVVLIQYVNIQIILCQLINF